MPDIGLQARAASLVQHATATRGDAFTAQRHIAGITDGRCSFEVGNPRQFVSFGATQKQLGNTHLQVLQWNAKTECQTSTDRLRDQHLVFHLALNGGFEVKQAGQRARVNQGQLLVVSDPGTIVRHWHGRCDLLNLVVPRERLAQCLHGEFGIEDDGDIWFDPLTVIDMSAIPTTIALLETVIADLDRAAPLFSHSLLSAQAERMLMLLLLKTLPHRHRKALDEKPTRVAPFYVRRAEAHMRDHLGSDITIEALAAASGVSVRTLYYGFGDFRDVSPMRRLKQMRLAKARDALLAAGTARCKIGTVASAVGYSSASQFSRDYKAQFGESPLETLGRAGERLGSD